MSTSVEEPSISLSFWSIVVIAANTMNGPGLTILPSIAQSAGLVTFGLLVVTATCVTAFCLHRLCSVIWMRKMHNCSTPRLGECDIVSLSEHAWPQRRSWARRLASIAMVCCALALALAQMMLCAKIGDAMVVASLGRSCGISVVRGGPALSMVHCTSNLSMKPFSQPEHSTIIIQQDPLAPSPPTCLITVGLVIAAAITISLASVDLDSMLTAQYVLFGCLLLACMQFSVRLKVNSVTATTTTPFEIKMFVGPRPLEAVGPMLMNFSFAVTAPPLVCGAKSRAEASRALVTACIIMGVLYTVIGWLGAPAASFADGDDNLLSLVLRGTVSLCDILSVSVFGLSQLAAIPVYCELAREMLVSHASVPTRVAFLVCHVMPWLMCALTYNSLLFESFIEWSSLLVLGFANFSLPLLLDLLLNEPQHDGIKSSDGCHRRAPGTGPCTVFWLFNFGTAGIAAVIVQRITNSIFLAELVFMATVLVILALSYYYHHHHGKLAQKRRRIVRHYAPLQTGETLKSASKLDAGIVGLC